MMGWLYGVAGVGLLLGTTWGYKLAAIPGTILVYHGISAWFWERNRRRAGHPLFGEGFRIVWCGANVAAGLLTLLVAWNAI